MFNSHSGLLGNSSGTWDTGFARKYLKISEEELKILRSNPGWSTSATENEEDIQAVELHPKTQLVTSNPQNTVHNFRSNQNPNPSEGLTTKPTLCPSKSKPSSQSKREFLKSFSLCSSNKIGDSSIPKVSTKVKSSLKTVSKDCSHTMSAEQSASCSSLKTVVLDTTYAVPNVLDDKTNDINIVSEVPQNVSSFQNLSAKKRSFENLEADEAKQFHDAATEFKSVHGFSDNTLSQVSSNKCLTKKLRLLEKRFSPMKDFSLTSSQEAIMANVNLKSVENQALSNPAKSITGSNMQVSSDSQINKEVPNSRENLAENPKEENNISNVEISLLKPVKIDSRKPGASVFEEESFVSPPIPCGQPVSSNQSTIETDAPSGLVNATEKANEEAPVSSRKHRVQEQEAVSSKANKPGRKKKNKSEGKAFKDKPVINVKYTPEQMGSIIQLMKHFALEMQCLEVQN